MEDQIKELKKLYDNASETEKEYVLELLNWLNEWLSQEPGDIETQDSGDHPPPPPPR